MCGIWGNRKAFRLFKLVTSLAELFVFQNFVLWLNVSRVTINLVTRPEVKDNYAAKPIILQ